MEIKIIKLFGQFKWRRWRRPISSQSFDKLDKDNIINHNDIDENVFISNNKNELLSSGNEKFINTKDNNIHDRFNK